MAFGSDANNLAADDDNAVGNIFLRDLDESTTALMSRATGAGGAGADDDSRAPVVSDSGRVAFDSLADNLSPDANNVLNVFVRDAFAGTTDAREPRARRDRGRWQRQLGAAGDDGGRALRGLHLRRHQPRGRDGSAGQHLPPRRPGRRASGHAGLQDPAAAAGPLRQGGHLHAHRLPAAHQPAHQPGRHPAPQRRGGAPRTAGWPRATCAATRSARPSSGPGITSAPAAASLAPVSPADPAAIVDPGRIGPGDPLTLSAAQLLINQRIDQAAIRRATGITNRLDAGLTGGDIKAAQVTQGKLYDRLQILAKTPTAEPPASTTTIPPRQSPPDPGSVTLSVGQLRINQRISQAGVRNANALIRRLETGLSGADLRPATLTAADLG